jgi:regulatory protein
MKITAVQALGGRGDQVEVRLEDGRELRLSSEVALRAGLRRGMEADEARLATLQEEDLRWRAREAALHLLSFRARSRAELASRLRRREFPPEVVESCVADLAAAGLLDDSAFAEAFVRDGIRGKPRGPRRLASELRAKGVAPEEVSAAIREVLGAEDVSEVELARQAAARWRPRPGEDPVRARRRLHGYLARRGFGHEAIHEVLAELDP